MTGDLHARADRALAQLRDLGPLADLAIRFRILAPRDTDATRAHRVAITPNGGEDVAIVADQTRERVLRATQLDYGPATLIPPAHCMRVAQDAAATLSAVQTEVDRADVEVFDANADYAAKATMVAARFSNQQGASATFYRVNETLLQFHKRKIFGLILSGGEYDRLDPTRLLLMRNEFDVVVVDGIAFFFAKTRFEQAFGFFDELRRASGETFDTVTTNLRIKNFKEFRDACTSQSQMMAKMASIKRSMDEDPTYAEAMTMPKITKFVRENPHLGIEIEGTGRAAQLIFNRATSTRYKIVNLLDDDYLRSELTRRRYEAGSKIRTEPAQS